MGGGGGTRWNVFLKEKVEDLKANVSCRIVESRLSDREVMGSTLRLTSRDVESF